MHNTRYINFSTVDCHMTSVFKKNLKETIMIHVVIFLNPPAGGGGGKGKSLNNL